MFCPECGTENPDNARFCGNCRHPLAGPAGGGHADSPVIELGADPQGTVSNGLKYGILVATLFIPFIGLVMGILYLVQGESEQKKDVGKLWLYASIAIMVFYLIISGDL
jgi:hypothetical protein